MSSSWNDLVSGERWRGIVSFIRNWVGVFDSHHGMSAEMLDSILAAKSLNLPAAIREWYLLAANWNQGGLNAWIRPEALDPGDGMVGLLTDTEGINLWGVRIADFHIEDPPVVDAYMDLSQIACPAFSLFVAAMIINDVLFGDRAEPFELVQDSTRGLTCLVSSGIGTFFLDGPLESASVVMFAYPGDGPRYGKSRTPEGRLWLERLRKLTQ